MEPCPPRPQGLRTLGNPARDLKKMNTYQLVSFSDIHDPIVQIVALNRHGSIIPSVILFTAHPRVATPDSRGNHPCRDIPGQVQ